MTLQPAGCSALDICCSYMFWHHRLPSCKHQPYLTRSSCPTVSTSHLLPCVLSCASCRLSSHSCCLYFLPHPRNHQVRSDPGRAALRVAGGKHGAPAGPRPRGGWQRKCWLPAGCWPPTQSCCLLLVPFQPALCIIRTSLLAADAPSVSRPVSATLQAFTYAIERSCVNKAEVVAADEKEGGVRATLNLGHTFGHAIETCTGEGTGWALAL